MTNYLQNLIEWTAVNDMQLNTSKTKEMILGRLAQTNLPLLTTSTGTIERVTSFKLLGVYIDSSLSWTTHINNITKKATRRLYFLNQLKRAGLTINQLLHYYTVVIRPVLEYCAPAWHYALTKTQAEQLEALQKRALCIILNSTPGTPYIFMLSSLNLTTLASRRNDISRTFFDKISLPSSCLHHLLPVPREHSITSRLRHHQKYPKVYTRTKRYTSYIHHAINNYQDKIYNS